MNSIYNLFLKLNKYKFTHPNYYYIWFNFLISQNPSINSQLIINKLNNLFDFLDKNNDISESDLLTILIILQINNNLYSDRIF